MSSPAGTKKIIAMVLRFVAWLIVGKKTKNNPLKPLDNGNKEQ